MLWEPKGQRCKGDLLEGRDAGCSVLRSGVRVRLVLAGVAGGGGPSRKIRSWHPINSIPKISQHACLDCWLAIPQHALDLGDVLLYGEAFAQICHIE
jgi:hypothetical protein